MKRLRIRSIQALSLAKHCKLKPSIAITIISAIIELTLLINQSEVIVGGDRWCSDSEEGVLEMFKTKFNEGGKAR